MPTPLAILPSSQFLHPGQQKLTEEELHDRREWVFLILAGIFLGSLTMLNILGVSRFIDLSFTLPLLEWKIPFVMALGVLPYPITFLCTDFISELYGHRRANQVVWVGLILNLWVLAVLYVGGIVPGTTADTHAPTGAFMEIRRLAFGAVFASMIAYLTAQFVDVYLFHFWRSLTKGKHLWLRNNGSTMISQMVDTVAVILITHFATGTIPLNESAGVWPQLWAIIGASYVFKLAAALLDTIPFYIGTGIFCRYLRLPPPDHGHIRPPVAE